MGDDLHPHCSPWLLLPQPDLGLGSGRGHNFVGSCQLHPAGESPCLVLAGSPWPTSLGNAIADLLGARSGSGFTSSLSVACAVPASSSVPRAQPMASSRACGGWHLSPRGAGAHQDEDCRSRCFGRSGGAGHGAQSSAVPS